jgi:hypothetical protein
MSVRLRAPGWGVVPTLILALMCAVVVPAFAQPKGKKGSDKTGSTNSGPTTVKPETTSDKGDKSDKDKSDVDKADKSKKGDKIKNFDFNALDLNGRMRTPQLLYFLERANEELERASLEKRSFIPHMVRSVEEEQL